MINGTCGGARHFFREMPCRLGPLSPPPSPRFTHRSTRRPPCHGPRDVRRAPIRRRTLPPRRRQQAAVRGAVGGSGHVHRGRFAPRVAPDSQGQPQSTTGLRSWIACMHCHSRAVPVGNHIYDRTSTSGPHHRLDLSFASEVRTHQTPPEHFRDTWTPRGTAMRLDWSLHLVSPPPLLTCRATRPTRRAAPRGETCRTASSVRHAHTSKDALPPTHSDAPLSIAHLSTPRRPVVCFASAALR